MSAWTDFLAELDDARAGLDFRPGERCLYRGHANLDWALVPTLLRHASTAGLHSHKTRQLEARLFFEFRARARELHPFPLAGWEILQYMRHHGIATRLLDWTEILGVALYFALLDEECTAPCIWIMNPYLLNEQPESKSVRSLAQPENLGRKPGLPGEPEQSDYEFFLSHWWEPMPFRFPIAVYPVQRNARLYAQQGYFTVHGQDPGSLDALAPMAVRKICIPADALDDARSFLSLAGINDYTMFPDLDGLARDLHRKHAIT
ncbi:MAG TPA: FRG domain-containing protein [Longimicrobium sp.]|nr:FRG domain-containing protein [Longimicrobium sp.]